MTMDADDVVRSNAMRSGKRAFGTHWSPLQWSVGPGRLELLGNHVDYNGGLVLAGAIDRSIWIAIAAGTESGSIQAVADDVSDRAFSLSTEPEKLEIEFDIDSGIGPKQYLQGVLRAMSAGGLDIRGSLQLSIAGDVPIGFGMSSSAGLCVALINALSRVQLPARDIVLIAQDAEHRAGSPVGAMDQSASVAGGIILFNGATMSFRHLEPDLGHYVFAVANSGVSHALGSSSYPRRVEESRRALELIRRHVAPDLRALGALEPDMWTAIKGEHVPGMNGTLTSRVDHIVSEVQRVREGVTAVEEANWPEFGRLMTASGRSSATHYDISHPLVEELVGDLLRIPGVAGARMMGGGEGGPALALIEAEAIAEVRSSLAEGYDSRHELPSSGERLEVCRFGPGARLLAASTDFSKGEHES